MLTNNEKFFICSFFNEGGYVLDFSNQTFDQFTTRAVGVPLKTEFRLSKGQSLASFILERASDEQILTLVLSLIAYARKRALHLSPRQEKLLPDLQKVIEKHEHERAFSLDFVRRSRFEFNEKYIANQFEMMSQMLDTAPRAAMRQAKILLCTCFKHILDEIGIAYEVDEALSILRHKVFTALHMSPQQHECADNNDEIIDMLQAVTTIVDSVDNLKPTNGASLSTRESERIYSELMMRATVTLVLFTWRIFNVHVKKAS
jgi:hypothetical protein